MHVHEVISSEPGMSIQGFPRGGGGGQKWMEKKIWGWGGGYDVM